MISAVIPVYKEPNILQFRDRLIHALTQKGMPYHWEIVWCTGDPLSYALLHQVKRHNEKILHESERGLGRALKLGFEFVDSTADWILTMDSDGQQLPEELPIFWNEVQYGMYDCLAGRYAIKDERSRWRKFISKLATWVISHRHRLGLTNITSDYRLYWASGIRQMMNENPPKGNDFECVPEILIRLSQLGRYQFKNVDISFPARKAGVSHARLPIRAYLRLLL